MFKKLAMAISMVSVILTAQPVYGMDFLKSLFHTTAAVAQSSTLNSEEQRQLQVTVIPGLQVHAYSAHLLEQNQQKTASLMQSSHDLLALVPSSLVATKLFSKYAHSNMNVAALLACTFGGITWFASREWMKKAPQQAANVNPFVFIPRGALWLYEKLVIQAMRENHVSQNVLETASHLARGGEQLSIPQYDCFLNRLGDKTINVPRRTQTFAEQLTHIYDR